MQRVGQEGLTARRPQPQAEPSLAHITRRTSTELRPTAAARSFALWCLGFRPFYLLASIYAAVSIPLWVCQYVGYLPAAYWRSQVWHGHEMLFGYTLAVIAGFLFTAVRTWTGQPTPTGATLAAFALLWIAGRVLVVTPYEAAAAAVNAAFPVAVAIGIGIPLWRNRNRRNYFFAAVLLFVGLAVLALHLSYLGVLAWPEWASLQVGLDLVLFILTVMGGRVIPMFTNNGIPGDSGHSQSARRETGIGRNPGLARSRCTTSSCGSGCSAGGCCRGCACRAPLSVAAVADHEDAAGVDPARVIRLDCRLSRPASTCRYRRGGGVACGSRADDWRDWRHDHRHDDTHRTRPYRAPDYGGRLRGDVLRSHSTRGVDPRPGWHARPRRLLGNRHRLRHLLVCCIRHLRGALLAGVVAGAPRRQARLGTGGQSIHEVHDVARWPISIASFGSNRRFSLTPSLA